MTLFMNIILGCVDVTHRGPWTVLPLHIPGVAQNTVTVSTAVNRNIFPHKRKWTNNFVGTLCKYAGLQNSFLPTCFGLC